MLVPNQKGTKLFGADRKEVAFVKRSKPEILDFTSTLGGERFRDIEDDQNGYSLAERKEEQNFKGLYRLENPDGDGGWVFLNEDESELVLGSNFYLIDTGYSSPGPEIR